VSVISSLGTAILSHLLGCTITAAVLRANKKETLSRNMICCLFCSALRPPIPGAELKNIFVVRTIEDSYGIHGQLGPEKSVVILGASFVGQYMFCSN
jgi:NAD(P)H-nitrite reductase large subunit